MKYHSYLTDSKWQVIAKFFSDKEIVRKRRYPLREIISAIFYLVKSGVQWRMLPNGFPDWELIYYYF